VTAAHRSRELDEIIDWLGETIRQTDSSLLDEWESMTHPENPTVHTGVAAAPVRPLSANETALRTMVRKAMWRRVQLAARDDVDGLYAAEQASAALTDPPGEVVMDRVAWDEALGAYWGEHDEIQVTGDAQGPAMLAITPDPEAPRTWRARQTLADPEGDHDWVIEAEADLDASDAVGELILRGTALRRL
jgi:hypothetical protein